MFLGCPDDWTGKRSALTSAATRVICSRNIPYQHESREPRFVRVSIYLRLLAYRFALNQCVFNSAHPLSAAATAATSADDLSNDTDSDRYAEQFGDEDCSGPEHGGSTTKEGDKAGRDAEAGLNASVPLSVSHVTLPLHPPPLLPLQQLPPGPHPSSMRPSCVAPFITSTTARPPLSYPSFRASRWSCPSASTRPANGPPVTCCRRCPGQHSLTLPAPPLHHPRIVDRTRLPLSQRPFRFEHLRQRPAKNWELLGPSPREQGRSFRRRRSVFTAAHATRSALRELPRPSHQSSATGTSRQKVLAQVLPPHTRATYVCNACSSRSRAGAAAVHA